MNEFEIIKQQLEALEEAYEADDETSYKRFHNALANINIGLWRKMRLLVDVAEAAIKWNSEPGMKLYRDTSRIESEVAKLLEEVEQ